MAAPQNDGNLVNIMILPFLKSLCLSIYHYFYLSIYQSILIAVDPGASIGLVTIVMLPPLELKNT